MARVLRVGGRALIYVWAKNQAKDSRLSSYLRQNKRNAIKSTDEVPDQLTKENVKYVDGLPVHTNRTQFVHQDMLVPWKLKSSDETAPAADFLRFYHVFEEHELEKMVALVDGLRLVHSYYDQGNWCVIFEKVNS